MKVKARIEDENTPFPFNGAWIEIDIDFSTWKGVELLEVPTNPLKLKIEDRTYYIYNDGWIYSYHSKIPISDLVELQEYCKVNNIQVTGFSKSE